MVAMATATRVSGNTRLNGLTITLRVRCKFWFRPVALQKQQRENDKIQSFLENVSSHDGEFFIISRLSWPKSRPYIFSRPLGTSRN